MKISKIIIKNFQQFQDFEIDLTYPKGHKKEGQALDKVCFIGRNGTGKSTLLEIVNSNLIDEDYFGNMSENNASILIKLQNDNKVLYRYRKIDNRKGKICFGVKKEYLFQVKNTTEWEKKIFNLDSSIKKFEITDEDEDFSLINGDEDLIVFSPPEGDLNEYNRILDVPEGNIEDANQIYKHFSTYHTVNSDSLSNFWNLIIFLIKKREKDYLEFLNRSENLDLAYRVIKANFDNSNSFILKELSILWNTILNKAGLKFDDKRAEIPTQLFDNLKAYITTINENHKINYNQLSTGIRNFIFRLGHIYSLYFNRNIKRGFLLIDEPENSLFPDFLFDLVDNYFKLTKNTQLFIATHSAIISAQFEPCERIILEFDDDGFVSSRKGVTATGDDPNDMLKNDFGLTSLLGKEGIKNWERYIELKILIKKESNNSKKEKMIEEFMEIGNNYNF